MNILILRQYHINLVTLEQLIESKAKEVVPALTGALPVPLQRPPPTAISVSKPKGNRVAFQV